MIVNLNEPSKDQMPVGNHINPATGEESFFWTGKVAIGVRCASYQPHFSPLPQHELQELAKAQREKR